MFYVIVDEVKQVCRTVLSLLDMSCQLPIPYIAETQRQRRLVTEHDLLIFR